MKTMQTELERLNPELYHVFMESMHKATIEWFPSVIPKLSSYNSLPHVLGVMRYTDMLLYDDVYGSVDIELNDVELYIMLNSILFHDIGKCMPLLKDFPGHAEESRQIIVDHWPELGIKSQRMALVISRIVLFHDSDDLDDVKKAKGKTKYIKEQEDIELIYIKEQEELSKLGYQTTISSYNFVRSSLLATLLYLADHLDNSGNRVIPSYIEKQHKVIGRIRENIISNYFDKYCKMVCIEVADSLFDNVQLICDNKECGKENTNTTDEQDIIETNGEITGETSKSPKESDKKLVELVNSIMANNEYIRANLKNIVDSEISDINRSISELMECKICNECQRCKHITKEGLVIWKLDDQCKTYLACEREKERRNKSGDDNIECESCYIESVLKAQEYIENLQKACNVFTKNIENAGNNLNVSNVFTKVLENTYDNNKAMEKIKRELQVIGIPIEKWLINVRGLLIGVEIRIETDEEGQDIKLYTIGLELEPILDIEYCEDVLKAMIDINTSVYGIEYHSYEAIANYIHEDIIEIKKVKCAANRLSKVLEEYYKYYEQKQEKEKDESICQIKILCDDRGWKIKIEDDKDETVEEYAKEIFTQFKKALGGEYR